MEHKDEAIFRSAEMSLVQLYVPNEVSRDVLHAIGSSGLVQFRDLNSGVSDFQRSFVGEVRKLDNITRQYTYFKKELDRAGIPVRAYPYELDTAPQSEIDEFQQNGQILEDRVRQLTDACDTLRGTQRDLRQHQATVAGTGRFFERAGAGGDHDDASNFVAGVVDRVKIGPLQQILWRVLRGNLYYQSEPLETGAEPGHERDYFIIFSHGSLVHQRVSKICESLGADLYEVESSSAGRAKQASEINAKLNDLGRVLEESQTALTSELIAISSDLGRWWEIVARERAVYETMNLCDYDASRQTLVAEGWVPSDDIDDLNDLVRQSDSAVAPIVNVLQTSKIPPTYHRTNKFTEAFQSICDAYGVASYREVNPGLPTIITFPFMFAIMFGDLGHGLLLFGIAAGLVLKEKQLGAMKRGEIFDMAFTGRYVLLLMGAFSIYTGTLYNDIFSKSMTIFRSGWSWPEKFEPGTSLTATPTGTYVFGLDWAWHGAENALLFSNSYKMKLSILLGYIHMLYSYMFSLVNHINFHSGIDIIGNFIPGLLFMSSLFGYLSVCIVYKWSVDWFATGRQPPGLLNMLISMFLSPGTVAEPLYNGQAGFQVFLLLVALICVPWLLLVKPLYVKRQMDKHQSYAPVPGSEPGVSESDEQEEHSIGDVVIHQVIHTIEFCLNCVSHTASYLRLWALSLAHAQLSTVLWDMTIGGAFGVHGIIGVVMTVVLFAMWFTLTMAVLVGMEGTSAMLHSLRLHWVESMSKYFVGEGYPYEPFKFKGMLDDVL
ncbi:V-type proton ATPase subunit a, vacuolar isoform [Diutina catenulata]